MTGIHPVSVCAVEDFVKDRPRNQLPARRGEDLRQEQVWAWKKLRAAPLLENLLRMMQVACMQGLMT